MTSMKQLIAGIADSAGYTGPESTVFLNFKAHDDSQKGSTNRIMLKAESISINTNRQVAPIPVPFSGAVTGESRTLAIDLGIATKEISVQGIITDQLISKKFSGVTDEVVVSMTAFEVAQLLHSAVDSSFLQSHQTISQLVVLMPSRVNKHYRYHSGVTSTTAVDDLPLVPFNYKARKLLTVNGGYTADNTQFDSTDATHEIKPGDTEFTILTGDFPDPDDYKGLDGYITNLSTNVNPGEPFINFNFSFVLAYIPFGG